MSVRITRTGTEVVLDHNELANKGKRTHAEIDSYLQELDDARENKPSLKDKFRELKDKDDEQDRQLDAVKSDVSTFQTRLNTLSSTVSAAEAKNQTQDLRLSQVEQKNAQQDQAILKLQSDVSSNPNAEVVAARRDRDGRTFPSLKARLDDMQGKIGTGGGGGNNGGASSSSFDLQTPINILLNTFRDAETHNRSAYRQNNMYVDVFSDSSGIDTEKSSSFGIINGTLLPGLHDTNIIMSSPTEPAPYHVSSSSDTSDYPGWLGLNGVLTDYYYSNGVTPPVDGHWWQIDFSIPKIITKLAIKPLRISNGQYSLASFTLQGSHDDTNWTDIYAASHVNTDSETEHNFTNTTAYRYYRMAKLRSHRSANPVIYTGWHEIKFYEIIDAVTLVTKAINVGRSPNKIITTAEYTDAVTFDLTLDGTTWVNNIDLNKLLDTSSLKGTNLQLRANIPATGSLKSLGFTWYDDSMLIPFPGSGSPTTGGPSVKADPAIGSMLLNNTVNLIKTNFLEAKSKNEPRYDLKDCVIDVFSDDSGINSSLSSSHVVSGGSLLPGYSSNMIPAMTSNTTPSGIASASSVHSAFQTEPWYAFDKDTSPLNTLWAPHGIPHGWLQYEFESPQVISKYAITATKATDINLLGSQRDWTFEGYSDKESRWIILDQRTNVSTWKPAELREYVFFNNHPYKKYRINVTGNNGHSLLEIQELAMMTSASSSIVTSISNHKNAPTKMVIVAEYSGDVTFDLSTNGGTTWTNNVLLETFIELKEAGKEICLRINLSPNSKVDAIGYAWFDDSISLINSSPSSGGNNSTSIFQIEKFDVIASIQSPFEVNIPISKTTDFKLPPVEVLKFAPGANDQLITISSFSSSEDKNYDLDSHMLLDGKIRLKTDYTIEPFEEIPLPSGNTLYSFPIDLVQFFNIEKIEVN
ncbi:discoidin domain-containing protein [Brevibacillus porteri]|uniref:discoidin domain-containing protein n=1 Tax=Brevibacillus porteri TaxID=2126350 RepID=UPI003D218CEB